MFGGVRVEPTGSRPVPVSQAIRNTSRVSLPGVIPEIDIWRVANLMLKRYGGEAMAHSYRHAEELATSGDDAGAAVWRQITGAIEQLTNTIPPGPLH